MSLTKEEQDWVKENMREDFTVGFSEKLYFIHDKLVNTPSHVPGDESESDGFFCSSCGKSQIPDIGDHVLYCMNVRRPTYPTYFLLFDDGKTRWLSKDYPTEQEALIDAKKSEVPCSVMLWKGRVQKKKENDSLV